VLETGFETGFEMDVLLSPVAGDQLYVKPAPAGVTDKEEVPPKQIVSFIPASTVNPAVIVTFTVVIGLTQPAALVVCTK
jgi:hypothetical protein